MKRTVIELTLQQARNLQLAAQGFWDAPTKRASRKALRDCIARMGLLQIDTIHVVARSPYLVLFSRMGSYPASWLEDALAEGDLFETWAHEACFAPASDLLAHRVYNRDARSHWGLVHAQKVHAKQRAELDALLAHIHSNGPVKSSDFEKPEGGTSAWCGWQDEKRWLEALFASGELMVARRDKFQRVYDLAHRVAPQLSVDPSASVDYGTALASEPTELPNVAAVGSQFIQQSVAALGVRQARWIHDYYRSKPRLKDADLDEQVAQGWDAPGYVHADHAALLRKAAADILQASYTALLSPFDPIVWDRERASTLFDFDYRLECYTPEPKRVYGYFVLPILCRGALIGRLNAKAHRGEGVFEVKSVHAQPGMRWTELQTAEVARAILRCAQWHATPAVTIGRTQPGKLAPALRRALRAAFNEDESA